MVRRGEIYWLALPPGIGSEQEGRRPVLIVQNEVGNRFSPTTIVAAITSQPRRRGYPFHVPFTAQESRLTLDGTVLCEQIYTIDQRRLGDRSGALSDDKMREIDLALHRSLGLEH
ncbi:MAG: type II toxin-antitoxin system PemK/MazF family toxin [Chloroflexi bacterium]|nr:type II toxin-antitoxin system PemK/MazF family toxin [Chloroflexota bacterium]